MRNAIFSQNQDMPIEWFDKFDKQAIKEAILAHLKANPTDTLEHCKEYRVSDVNKFYGMEIVNFYQVNPKNNKISLVYTRNGKEYFKSIE
jgi:hypothetical protein